MALFIQQILLISTTHEKLEEQPLLTYAGKNKIPWMD